jgi:hypothetical protein
VSGLWWNWPWYVLAQGFLDSLGAGASDALVDRECLLKVSGGLVRVAVVEVAAADSLQCACLLQGCADVAGDDERLVVVVAGLAGG